MDWKSTQNFDSNATNILSFKYFTKYQKLFISIEIFKTSWHWEHFSIFWLTTHSLRMKKFRFRRIESCEWTYRYWTKTKQTTSHLHHKGTNPLTRRIVLSCRNFFCRGRELYRGIMPGVQPLTIARKSRGWIKIATGDWWCHANVRKRWDQRQNIVKKMTLTIHFYYEN